MEIWSIEDDPDDMRFLRMAAERAAVEGLRIFPSALEAAEALDRKQGFPGLILLDLNLPGMSGQEFLRLLRQRSDAWYVPVVVLTSSTNNADKAAAYACGANAYLVKPNTVQALAELMRDLGTFWSHVALPRAFV
ncbi:MAG: response regulator [Myxococcota bacterium]